ncbi:MAG: PAS domain S-box protein [Thermotogota bacterium]
MKVRAALERRHTALLVVLLALITLAVTYSTIEALYRTAVIEERARLTEMARSQARLIESIARHEREAGSDLERARAVTIDEVAAAHAQYQSVGRTGEFALASRDGETIRLLLTHASATAMGSSTEIAWNSRLAEPMRRALRGESGTVIGLDYRGHEVLAAYEPVDVLNLGIVAKIDLAEVQAPFRRAALMAAALAFGAILLGAWAFTCLSRPLVRRMKETQQRYEDVVEMMGEGLAFQDADGRLTYVNDRLCEMTGFQKHDVLGRRVDEFFHEDFRDEYRRQMEFRRAGQTDSYEVTLKHRDGSPVYVLLAPRALHDAAGRFVGSFAVVSQITDLKRTEQALRQEKGRAQLYLDIVGAVIVALDTEGRVTLVNRRALEVLGYESPADLVGRDWFSTCLPAEVSDDVRGVFGRIVAGDLADFEHVENFVVRPDGERRRILWHNTILRDPEGGITGTLSSGEDITGLRAQSERLAHVNAILRAIRDVNQLIVREKDRGRLLEEGCRALVATEGVRHAWAVELDSAGRPLRSGEAGLGESFEALRRPLVEGELPACCRRALEAGGLVVFSDPEEECAGCPVGGRHADTAAVAVPLRHETHIHGVLVVGIPKAWASDDEELALFREIAGDLAFALHDLDTADARERAETALRESEGRYRSLFENAVLGIYQTTPDGRIVAANPALVAMLGYGSFEELAMRNLEQEAHSSLPRSEFRSWVERDGRVFDLEVRWRRKDGTMVNVRENAIAVRNEEGKVLYYEGTVEDITARRAAEEALRRSETRYRSLFENAVLGIYQTTPDGRILVANPALIRMLGFGSFEELAKRDLEVEGYGDGSPRASFKERLARDGFVLGNEAAWRRADGSVVRVRENAVVVRDPEGRIIGYEGTVEDITARWEAEQAKIRLEAQLRQSQKLESIGTLASGIAHEINNPLTGIINYAELIRARVDEANVREFAEGIVEEGNRVAKTVRSLLSFARQERESHSPADVADIVNATLPLIGAVLRRDQIEIVVDVPTDLPRIRCRSQQIRQVILNLLTNARDALNARFPGHDDRKRIEIRAETADHDSQRWVRLMVEDHGIGIPRAIQDRIFDPFFTTKPRDQGTGLGLAVSYGIVRDHRGTLSVESEENVFTRFTIELPAYDEDTVGGGEGG